ncbi:hypothetical protein J1N35_005054 [Gossypium stocksii]|uniref:Uncharacterized protein n=1 Tax=Gossypium stocksii TaxID=47602 RepID=A0A9D4AI94_9ROSI|nr:hypothetical protein J1N35_005054 [Gossypium stocksii]
MDHRFLNYMWNFQGQMKAFDRQHLFLFERDDVFPTTSIGERTSNIADVGGSENEDGNEFDVDPVRESSADSSEVVLFSKLDPIQTKQEVGEGG